MTVALVASPREAVDYTSSTSTGTLSVARASGEALVVLIWPSFSARTVTGVVWDSAGDNQAFTFAGALTSSINTDTRLECWYLANPTSAKTGDITATLNAAAGYVTMYAAHITGASTSDFLRGITVREEASMGANDLPATVSSSATDLVLFAGYVRDFTSAISAGDLSGYSEHNATGGGPHTMWFGSKPGDTSVTGTVTADAGSDYQNILFALSIKEASGGGGSSSGAASHYYRQMQ